MCRSSCSFLSPLVFLSNSRFLNKITGNVSNVLLIFFDNHMNAKSYFVVRRTYHALTSKICNCIQICINTLFIWNCFYTMRYFILKGRRLNSFCFSTYFYGVFFFSFCFSSAVVDKVSRWKPSTLRWETGKCQLSGYRSKTTAYRQLVERCHTNDRRQTNSE